MTGEGAHVVIPGMVISDASDHNGACLDMTTVH